MTGRAHLHEMRRWAEPLTVIVVFAVVMTAIGWMIRGGVEWSYPWVIDHIGRAGFWAIFLPVWLAAGVYAWRAHRPKAGKAAGK